MPPLWVMKAIIQKSLSKIPGGYHVNDRLQEILGRHDVTAVRLRVRGVVRFIDLTSRHVDLMGARILEIGTGWGAFNAFLLSLYGAQRIVATDYLAHLQFALARQYVEAIRAELDAVVQSTGRDKADLEREADNILAAETLEDMLARARIDYVAPLDIAKTTFPDRAFDMVYSYAVMAHLPESMLHLAAQESNRVLRSGGVIAHRIGLQDPYNWMNGGDNVNFLKFSETFWRLINHNSVQHNNRVRASEHRAALERLGAEIVEYDPVVHAESLERLKTMKVDRRFQGMTPEDLATISLSLVAKV